MDSDTFGKLCYGLAIIILSFTTCTEITKLETRVDALEVLVFELEGECP